MAHETNHVTSAGRRPLRRSPSSRDRALRDRDRSGSPAVRAPDYHARSPRPQEPSSPAQYARYHEPYHNTVSNSASAYMPPENSPSSMSPHITRIPGPRSSSRSSHAMPSSPPIYRQAGSEAVIHDSDITIGTNSYMMDYEYNPVTSSTPHQNQPFDSSHRHASMRPSEGLTVPVTLRPTGVRPPHSFSFERDALLPNWMKSCPQTGGPIPCNLRSCPHCDGILAAEEETANRLAHQNEASSAAIYTYRDGSYRDIYPGELGMAYSNPATSIDPYRAYAARNQARQDWQAGEQRALPFSYELEQARTARSEWSSRNSRSQSNDSRSRQSSTTDVVDRSTFRHGNPRGVHFASRAHRTTEDEMEMLEVFQEDQEAEEFYASAYERRNEGRSTPRPSRSDRRSVEMVEVRTPGGMRVRIVEAARSMRNT